MEHTLPKLNYTYNSLEPYIDAKTMEIHHSKHHQTYVTNLAKALETHPDLAVKPLEYLLANLNDIPETIRTAVKNHGGGVYNHTMFWSFMTPDENEKKMINAKLREKLEKQFGSIENFKAEFSKSAMGKFGSGWTWLVINAQGTLEIMSTSNQDTPISEGKKIILGIDLWEHAYYLKYQNKRAEYIENWWNVVNWAKVSEYFEN